MVYSLCALVAWLFSGLASAQASSDAPTTSNFESEPTPAALSTPAARVRIFSRGPLFGPLTADPRWPRIALGYSYYFGNAPFEHVGVAEAGAFIPIVQSMNPPEAFNWELGVQGGVFSIFDFAAPSKDLVNADYAAGIAFTFKIDAFSLITRYIHQSSHLGDEYLLHNNVQRINLSFEEINILASYEALHWLEVYGGSAVIVRHDPSTLDLWSLQAGIEARPITASTPRRLQLLLALDLRTWQQNDWEPDVSFVAGPTLDPGEPSSYRVDFVIRYFYGHSRSGQFFAKRVHSLGPAVQLFF